MALWTFVSGGVGNRGVGLVEYSQGGGPRVCGEMEARIRGLHGYLRRFSCPLPSEHISRLQNLQLEKVPEIFDSDLMELAREFSQEGYLEEAMGLYSLLRDQGNSSAYSELAAERMKVLSGQGGSLTNRLEFQAGRFLEGVTDPAMVAGMAFGATAYTLSRSMLLPRLLTSPGAFLRETPFAAHVISSGLSTLPEVAAFWSASKGVQFLLRPQSDLGDLNSNIREMFSMGLTLGLMKSFGFIFGGGWLGRNFALGNHAGMLAGIYASHNLEMRRGWRPPQTQESLLLDSLVMLAQFSVGGSLSRSLFPRLYSFNAQVQQRTHHQELHSILDFGVQPVTVEGFKLFVNSSLKSETPSANILMMASDAPESSQKISPYEKLPFTLPPGERISSRYKERFNEIAEELQLNTRWKGDSPEPSEAMEGEVQNIATRLEEVRRAKVKESYGINERATVVPPIHLLNPTERLALRHLAERVKPLVNEIYSLQENPRNGVYWKWMEQQGDVYSKVLFQRHQRDTGVGHLVNDPSLSLFPFFPEKPGYNGMFSSEVSAKEWSALEKTLPRNDPLLAPDTIVIKSKTGAFEAQPMAKSPLFEPLLRDLAKELRAIAGLKIEGSGLSVSLQRQLRSLARAFETGEPGDTRKALQSTLSQKDGGLRVLLGPFDKIWGDGSKGAFIFQVGIRDPKIGKDLQALDDVAVRVAEDIILPGDRPQRTSFALDSLEPVHQALVAGSMGTFPIREISGNSINGSDFFNSGGELKTVHLEVLPHISRRNSLALARVLHPEQIVAPGEINLEAFIAAHEKAHLLGPQASDRVLDGNSVQSAFGRRYLDFEESKADLGAVVLALEGNRMGGLSPEMAKGIYLAHLSYLFSNRYKGKSRKLDLGGHDFARMTQVGFMFQQGAFSLISTGQGPRIQVQFENYPLVAREMWQKIMEFQIEGNVGKARQFGLNLIDRIPEPADRLILDSNQGIPHFFLNREI